MTETEAFIGLTICVYLAFVAVVVGIIVVQATLEDYKKKPKTIKTRKTSYLSLWIK